MRLLLITYVWPEPTSSAAGVRDIALLKHFKDLGWETTCVSPSAPNAFSERIEKELGVATRTFPANDSRFDEFVSGLQPDFAVFDRFVIEEQFGWRVANASPRTVRVVDTQDLHFLRRAREAALKEGRSLEDIAACRIPLRTEDSYREIASIYRSDLTLVLSDFERDLLRNEFQVAKELLHLCPFSYPEPEPGPPFEERRGFAVIGNFRHPPNADGVRWLKREIWPLVRSELPSAEVHVYGAYPPREFMEMDDPATGFRVRGPARDAIATLARHRVNLAPLRFGAGIKGKIADGWWSATPAVSTPVGSEGMTGGLDFGGAVSRSALEFSRAAIRMHEDADSWSAASRRGLAIHRRLFDERRNGAALAAALLRAREELAARRERNFVGSMLSHHLHRSTEYFSRWIEAKNSAGPREAKASAVQ